MGEKQSYVEKKLTFRVEFQKLFVSIDENILAIYNKLIIMSP